MSIYIFLSKITASFFFVLALCLPQPHIILAATETIDRITKVHAYSNSTLVIYLYHVHSDQDGWCSTIQHQESIYDELQTIVLAIGVSGIVEREKKRGASNHILIKDR